MKKEAHLTALVEILLPLPLDREVNMELFKQMIEAGADVNETDYNKLTALWYAAEHGKFEAAKVLIEHGADIEFRDRFGNTPLLRAVANFYKVPDGKLIKLLIDAGANKDATNIAGVSPRSLSKTLMGFPYQDLFE